MTEDEALPPPVTLGPYTVEYLGRRRGLLALRVRVGRHVLELFATPAKGLAARVSAELDGRALVKRRKRRPYRVWSNDVNVKRWLLCAASETYRDGRPRWTVEEIARNLKRSLSFPHAEMSETSVHRLIWRLSPGLAARRSDWHTKLAQRPTVTRKVRSQRDAEHRAALKAAALDELKRAGLI